MRQLIIFTFIFILSIPSISGQTQQEKLNRFLRSVQKEAAAPGFSVSIVEKGEVIYEAAFGKELLGEEAAMRLESVLPIGSLTKSMTALALMQLVEKGQLDLDKAIVHYLPDFQTANSALSDKITCRMLLNNSSALYGGYSDGSLKEDAATFQLIRSLEGIYLEQEPGLYYRYSNTGFSVAGYLLHAISGESYAGYLTKHIFEPLGMNSTTTRSADFERLKSTYGHYYGMEKAIPAHSERNQAAEAMIAAGSLMRSSAKDLSAYMMALLNPEKFGILDVRSRDKLWETQSCFTGFSYEEGGEDEEFGYGLGWMRGNIEGKDLVFHGGSTGTASSIMILDPAHEIGVVVLLNLDYTFIDRYRFRSEFNIAYNLLRIVLGENPNAYGQPRIPDPSLNEFELDDKLYDRYIGSYQFAGGGDNFVYHGVELEIKEAQGGGLMGEVYRGKDLISQFKLDFVSRGLAMRRFQAQADPVRFRLDRSGEAKGVSVFGTRFIRRDSSYYTRYQELKAESWTCLFPKSYRIDYSEEGYIATNKDAYQIRMGFDMLKEEELIQEYFPNQSFEKQGKGQQQKMGAILWKQESFLGKNQQLLLLSSQLQGKNFKILMRTPRGKLSRAASTDLYGILRSFSLKE